MYLDKDTNTFGRIGRKRGNFTIMKRDYELTEQQLERRNKQRERKNIKQKELTRMGYWFGMMENLTI